MESTWQNGTSGISSAVATMKWLRTFKEECAEYILHMAKPLNFLYAERKAVQTGYSRSIISGFNFFPFEPLIGNHFLGRTTAVTID